MNNYIRKIFEALNFNNNIFNKEDSYYDNSKIFDNYTYKNVVEKLMNAELVSEEELEYVCRLKKYKVSSKEELKKIIKKYSKKNPKGSLNWIDTSLITDMSELFKNSEYNGDISEWNTSNVINMSYMFLNNKMFNQYIGDWNVSNVISMEGMFLEAYAFNQPIGDWNIKSAINIAFMFYNAKSFNQDISNWNVINALYMIKMFFGTESFNQDISNWLLNPKVNKFRMFMKSKINKKYQP